VQRAAVVRERRWLQGDGYLHGRVYLDGSALDTNWADAAVGAWAAVCYDGSAADASATLVGPLDELVVDSDGAELTALLECMAVAIPPIVVVTDSDFVYKGVVQLGRLRTTRRGAAWVQLWENFWRLYDEFGA